MKEKIGYDATISYNDWVAYTGYENYDYGVDIAKLYDEEMKMIKSILDEDFSDFCATRLDFLKNYFKKKAGYNYE